MNFELGQIPERTQKPREYGFTMAMDKGLSIREVEDFLSMCSDYVDIVKLGWGTSFVTPKLEEKLQVYREAKIPVYFGGTLFEAFIVRNQFDDYRRVLDKYRIEPMPKYRTALLSWTMTRNVNTSASFPSR